MKCILSYSPDALRGSPWDTVYKVKEPTPGCKVGRGNLERGVTWNGTPFFSCTETSAARAILRQGARRSISALSCLVLQCSQLGLYRLNLRANSSAVSCKSRKSIHLHSSMPAKQRRFSMKMLIKYDICKN